MNYFPLHIPHRWEQTTPVAPVQPYSGFSSYMGQESEGRRSPNTYKEDRQPAKAERSDVLPGMNEFAQHVAHLVQAAQEIVEEAARLRQLPQLEEADLSAFYVHVNNLRAIDEEHFQLLDEWETDIDSAYLPSYSETIQSWEDKAGKILTSSPKSLMIDDRNFHSYASYTEDRQKTWQLPHQGLLIQTYG